MSSVEHATEEPTAAGSPRALVVLNPVAGTSSPDEVRTLLDAAFATQGWSYELHETQPDEDLSGLAEQARRLGCEVVVAAGGDGTVSLVAHALMDSGLILGVVPVGTANVLARELDIPDDPGAAAALLVGDHRIRELDVMHIGARHFILQVGIGLDALMIRDTGREAKRSLGRLAYIKTLIAKVIGYQAHRFTLVVDGRRHRVRAWEVLVANAGTLGVPPFTWGPDIHPDDGELDLCVFNVRAPFDYVRLLWQLVTGRHKHGPNARYFRVRQRVSIVADHPLPTQADGEIIGETPVTIDVKPRAIRIITPLSIEPASPLTLAREAGKDDG